MLTVEGLKVIFERTKSGYWFVKKGTEKKGSTSESIEDDRDVEKQYNDFTALCEMLPEGTYKLFLQTSKSGSASQTNHEFKIGNGDSKGVQGVGNNNRMGYDGQNNGNNSMMMQMMTMMMQMQNQNQQLVLAQMDKQMDLSVKLAESKYATELQKVEGNKTVVDKLFKIGEMHLPSIINAVYKVPPVATTVGRAESEEGQTVPPPSKSAAKPGNEIADDKIKEAKAMGLRVQKVMQRIHKLNPTEHPMTTLEDCVSYLEANPAMLVALLAEQKQSNENTKA